MQVSASTPALGFRRRKQRPVTKPAKAIGDAILREDTDALGQLLRDSNTSVTEQLTFWAYLPHADLGLPACTPLHLAAYKQRVAVVRWLLQQGATAAAVDGVGRTPADVVVGDDGEAVLEVLRAAVRDGPVCSPHRCDPEPRLPASEPHRVRTPKVVHMGGGPPAMGARKPSPPQQPLSEMEEKVAAMRATIDVQRGVLQAARDEERTATAAAYKRLRAMQAELRDAEAMLAQQLDGVAVALRECEDTEAALADAERRVGVASRVAAAAKARLSDAEFALSSAAADAQRRTDDALAAARHSVTREELVEVQALLEPPAVVKQLLWAVHAVVSCSDVPAVSPARNPSPTPPCAVAAVGTERDGVVDDAGGTWAACRTLVRAESFVPSLLAVSPASLAADPSALAAATARLAVLGLSRSAAARAFAVCGPLWDWVSNVVAAASILADTSSPDENEVTQLRAAVDAADDEYAAAQAAERQAAARMEPSQRTVRSRLAAARSTRTLVVNLRVRCDQPLSDVWGGSSDVTAVTGARAGLQEAAAIAAAGTQTPRLQPVGGAPSSSSSKDAATAATAAPDRAASPSLLRIRRSSALSAEVVAGVAAATSVSPLPLAAPLRRASPSPTLPDTGRSVNSLGSSGLASSRSRGASFDTTGLSDSSAAQPSPGRPRHGSVVAVPSPLRRPSMFCPDGLPHLRADALPDKALSLSGSGDRWESRAGAGAGAGAGAASGRSAFFGPDACAAGAPFPAPAPAPAPAAASAALAAAAAAHALSSGDAHAPSPPLAAPRATAVSVGAVLSFPRTGSDSRSQSPGSDLPPSRSTALSAPHVTGPVRVTGPVATVAAAAVAAADGEQWSSGMSRPAPLRRPSTCTPQPPDADSGSVFSPSPVSAFRQASESPVSSPSPSAVSRASSTSLSRPPSGAMVSPSAVCQAQRRLSSASRTVTRRLAEALAYAEDSPS